MERYQLDDHGKLNIGNGSAGKEQLLTREEALRLFTVTPTWFEDNEREMGKIIPGNLADFVLFNKNYFTIPDEEIKTISSSLTVVNGRAVSGVDEFKNLSPKSCLKCFLHGRHLNITAGFTTTRIKYVIPDHKRGLLGRRVSSAAM